MNDVKFSSHSETVLYHPILSPQNGGILCCIYVARALLPKFNHRMEKVGRARTAARARAAALPRSARFSIYMYVLHFRMGSHLVACFQLSQGRDEEEEEEEEGRPASAIGLRASELNVGSPTTRPKDSTYVYDRKTAPCPEIESGFREGTCYRPRRTTTRAPQSPLSTSYFRPGRRESREGRGERASRHSATVGTFYVASRSGFPMERC